MLALAMLLILSAGSGVESAGHCNEINSQKNHENYPPATQTLIDLTRNMTAIAGSVG
jgi:hypothetical protein